MTDTADRAGDSVLGCLLAFYTPQLVTVIQATGLVWDDFTLDRQQVVYRAVLRLHAQGRLVDLLVVEAFLAGHGSLERAGGGGRLQLLVDAAVPSMVREHARLVCEGARQGRLVVASERLNRLARAWDDPEGLREAFGWVAREMREPVEHPKLRVVGEGKAA
jgi:replicative DNA helicase